MGGERKRRRWWRWPLWCGFAVALPLLAMHEYVRQCGGAYVFGVDDVPPREWIVVPGARIHADGTPYHLLEDRLAAAAALWRAGKGQRILLSGYGSGGIGEDEVAAMRRWLLAAGVPSAAMVDDPLGLRTLDTMYRLHDVFGAKGAIVVTNPFHVARAVFLGRQHGLDAVGAAAPYAHDYSRGTMWKNQGREVLARVWAVLDVTVFGTAAAR